MKTGSQPRSVVLVPGVRPECVDQFYTVVVLIGAMGAFEICLAKNGQGLILQFRCQCQSTFGLILFLVQQAAKTALDLVDCNTDFPGQRKSFGSQPRSVGSLY